MAKDYAIIWRAIIQDGGLIVLEKDKYDNFVRGLRNGEYELIVRKAKRSRSNQQNRYMWGVIIPMIAEEIGIFNEETHEFLKSMFLKKGIDYKGKRFEVIKSTADLSTIEMEEYLAQVRQWALSELNLNIPLPQEVDI